MDRIWSGWRSAYVAGEGADSRAAFDLAAGAPSVPHGLRKNAVIALLEAGSSTAQAAAVSGQSLQMVEYYARQRDQSTLADAAMLRWENRT